MTTNNFLVREYLVIQTYPLGKNIRVIYRTYNYLDAEIKCNSENMGNDYSSFATRLYYENKLWMPDSAGNPYKVSEQQFWEIHPDYEIYVIEKQQKLVFEKGMNEFLVNDEI